MRLVGRGGGAGAEPFFSSGERWDEDGTGEDAIDPLLGCTNVVEVLASVGKEDQIGPVWCEEGEVEALLGDSSKAPLPRRGEGEKPELAVLLFKPRGRILGNGGVTGVD